MSNHNTTQHTARRATGAALEGELNTTRIHILETVSKLLILDPDLAREWIRQRQERDIDRYDEVWEGVYIVPPLAINPHQDLVSDLSGIFFLVIKLEERGRVQAGANVSDRRRGWVHNYRDPDVVVVLNEGRAVDCGTHWFGGPDFLVEVLSPGDASEEKIPFYSQLQVQELLIIDPDSRQLRLYRHDGQQLTLVGPSPFQGGKWLVSQVLPLAFRRKTQRGAARTELRRTDGQTGHWTI